jgi:hypothetical protein
MRDPFLKEAEDWLMRAALKEQLPQPTDLQREYLSSSRAAEIRKARRWRGWLLAGMVLMLGVVLVILLLYLQAVRNAKEANSQKKIADQNAGEAKRQTQIAEENSKEANRQKGIAQTNAKEAKAQTVLANRRTQILLEERGRQELVEGRWDAADALLAETYRMGSDTPALRLMLAHAMLPLTGAIAVLEGGDSPITSAAFSPDGKRLIVGSVDGGARVWEVAKGRLAAVLSGHDGPVDEVHLNADGSRALVVFTKVYLDKAEPGYYRTYSIPAYVWDVARSVLVKDTLELGDWDTLHGGTHPWVRVLSEGAALRLSERQAVPILRWRGGHRRARRSTVGYTPNSPARRRFTGFRCIG